MYAYTQLSELWDAFATNVYVSPSTSTFRLCRPDFSTTHTTMSRLVRLSRPLARAPRRAYSDLSHTTLPKMPPTMPREDYASPTMYAFNMLGKTVKYIVIGGAGLTALSLAGWEAAHLYIEHQMPSAKSKPGSHGWEEENTSWTGEDGGTTSKLGWKARMALRAAWLCWEKGAGVPGAISTRQSIHPQLSGAIGGLNKIDRGYELAEQYIDVAIKDAEKRGMVFPPHEGADPVALDLVTLKASILERMGTPDTLEQARELYEDVARTPKPQTELNQALSIRLALKLSDLANRAGDSADAAKWRQWGLQTAGVQIPEPPKSSWWSKPKPEPVTVPELGAPVRRATVALLLSDSALAAQSGDLDHAAREHEVIRAMIPTPERLVTPNNTNAPEVLHSVWLAQRRALLDLYRGSVAHAQDRKSTAPLGTIALAAEESDAVIAALEPLPAAYKGPLLVPAERLRREALQTGAEAHFTEGVLEEKQGTEPALLKALASFERAMSLAALESGSSDIRGEKEDEGVGRSPEWTRYARAYDRVKAKLQ